MMFCLFCRQYLYVDEKNKKCKCPAPDYVNLVMSDCQKSIKDESVFPTKYGKWQIFLLDFTKSFRSHRALSDSDAKSGWKMTDFC